MTSEAHGYLSDRWSQFRNWAHEYGLSRKLAFALAVAAVVSGITTYAAITGSEPLARNSRTVVLLLLVNLTLLLSLAAIVVRRLVQLWVERRRGSAGSRLHTRLVAQFSLIAVAPAIVVGVFSALFLNFGLQNWFSERVRTAVTTSVAVAEAYLDEHRKVIRADTEAMAGDLNRIAPVYYRSSARFSQFLSAQARLRSLSETVVFTRDQGILARSQLTFAFDIDDIPEEALARAENGELVFFSSDADDRVRAVIRLDRLPDAFLYVAKNVDPRVIAHVESNRSAATAYEKLERDRSSIQITFLLIFSVVALLLLLVAVWLGLSFATRIVRPVSALVGAADQVRAGNLAVHVSEDRNDDEIGTLIRAFNRMTGQLDAQRSELIEANRQLDERRRFTEAVLAGVGAGVVGLDGDGRVTLPNRSALTLLALDRAAMVGHRLGELVPEMTPLIEEARQRPERVAQGQVTIERGGEGRHLLVRVATEQAAGAQAGYVVTFDDITQLVAAQRTAAWSDIARRIAHEIKNPLTPIQLSAERLKRKYLKEISSDRDTFSNCTDTIIRHVLDIGRLVDEFSSFARMPAPVFRIENLADIVDRALVLQRMARPEIHYVKLSPAETVEVRCDHRQISQVLTNLLQNAADSIEARRATEPGRVEVRVERGEGRHVTLYVEDNGKGFPRGALRARLTEPYVTTREKGTGLGLAIVKKIMDDHGGTLVLADRPGGGASVRIVFERPAALTNAAE